MSGDGGLPVFQRADAGHGGESGAEGSVIAESGLHSPIPSSHTTMRIYVDASENIISNAMDEYENMISKMFPDYMPH